MDFIEEAYIEIAPWNYQTKQTLQSLPKFSSGFTFLRKNYIFLQEKNISHIFQDTEFFANKTLNSVLMKLSKKENTIIF